MIYEKSVNDFIVNKTSIVYEPLKRIFDIVLSSIALVFALPVIILFGALVKIESAGAMFFSQERLGKDGISFNVYKIRSMYCDAEKNGAQWAKINDSRITTTGKFIRRTRIDELPQLVNILKGEMSIVGPRPERAVFTEKFNNEIPGFYNRLLVKPGLTGLAQINGGYNITPKNKLYYDLEYINNRTLLLDFIIMVKTIKVLITGEGAR